MDKYILERDGQLDFYRRFLPRVDSTLTAEDLLEDNNDGVLNGNLLEFKLHVTDINAVLFQCVKYLSALRIKGKPVPAGVHVIDLNAGIDWYFHSAPYLDSIEKPYYGGASKDNSGFIGGKPVHTLRYGESDLDAEKLIELLKERRYTKIHIDENCIVGWASAFYREKPMARKEDFLGDDTGAHKTIGEIRRPQMFKEYIYPYTGETNVKFNYLMDKLNDTLQKKNLGAFYTPPAYAEKSLELVRRAIARVPAGNNYIILDRCAGTGNLEAGLTDEELSHCIVSTVEYYEYKVLQELIGSKVRHIIPPTDTSETFNAGLVNGADALSKEYIENPVIRQYIDNPAYTIILFENPPFAEAHGSEKKMTGNWKSSFLRKEMQKECRKNAADDIGNVFIWSGFKYYLRQPADSYIVYSPVKYWKAQHLVNRIFLGGYAFNRRYFHLDIDACIMCALWSNEVDDTTDSFEIHGFDLSDKGELMDCGFLPVRKIYNNFSDKYYDKRKFNEDEKGIACYSDGLEESNRNFSLVPKYNPNIVGYLAPKGSGFDKPDLNCTLTTAAFYNAHGFYLRRDNYLEKLPMFAASRYITYNRKWTERTRIMKSADGAERFAADVASGKLKAFLLKCLLFTCTETQNHMRSFTGSDGRFYRNELCLDGTNGETLAMRDLRALTLNDTEKKIVEQWETLLSYAKATDKYDPALTYGVYQIFAEIDTFHEDETTGAKVPDYPEVHSAYATLKSLVKAYYNAEIVPVLFDYEFLK